MSIKNSHVKIGLMLILASRSPRRQELLSLLGVKYLVRSSELDERVVQGETPEEYVLRLAIAKSLSFNPLSAERLVVIGADTAVVDGEQILGKPADQQEAVDMLSRLRDRTHQVISGIAVRDTGRDEIYTDSCTTQVTMRLYELAEILEYVASGDPMDKAGAYAIQNSGFDPVAQISGCYANVVGLPLCHLANLLHSAGISFEASAVAGCRRGKTYNCKLAGKIRSLAAENQ